MIPILFDKTETTFTGNGLGRLADSVSCPVTEARNGIFELELSYPVTGRLFTSLVPGRYIFTTHNNSGKPQPFEIYQVDEPLEGVATVHAWHFSYALRNIIVRPFTATSCTDAVSKIVTNSINTNPFTFTTDKEVAGAFSLDVPRDVRSLLGGAEGSLLDVYGKGELEYDMYAVKLWLNRGTDRGVTIRYGKNLASLERQIDASNVFVSAVPYWTGMEDEPPVYYNGIVTRTGSQPGKAIPMDLSEDFDAAPTPAQLQARCQAKLDASDNYQVKENIEVDFVQLWQTEEYKDFQSLQQVFLCDTVHLEYTKRGISATAKVIKTIYDPLLERYVKIELGEPRTTYAQELQTSIVAPAVAGLPSKSFVQSTVDYVTTLITGGFGGHAVWHYLPDGTPSELLFLDTASEATAQKVLRINLNGIGFSQTGVNGPFTTAWGIDGTFVADFITAGTMVANRIRAGLLTDETGKNYWNLDTGQFVTKQGTLGPFTIDENGIQAPNVSISDTGISYASGSADGSTYIGISPTSIFGLLKASGSWGSAFSLSPWASGGYNYLELAIASLTNAMFFDRADTSRDTHNDFLGGVSVSGLLNAQNSLKVQGAAEISKHVYTDQAVTSSNPVVLYVGNDSVYWGGILFGVVQNVGAVVIAFTCDNGTLTARNLITNSAWTSSALGLSGSGTYLTITTDQPGTSYFSVFAG